MYLKELILEGFKSYAQRTVIRGFDKHFNAITGLNGSGKSNIMDSLIFLLGISGYKDLRASDSKDLIYKQGSAGITTATVTGVFDNTDPTRSPTGYDSDRVKTITVSRTILATGQSKYTINGTRCKQNQVQEMFQSVQLNVLNPHFIVMQGRIAKVWAMKPVELLKLIEEATGTAMYENKREQTLRNMERKEGTMKELPGLLRLLESQKSDLEKDAKKYEEFRRLEPTLKRLKRLCIAYEYLEYKNQINNLSADKQRTTDEAQRLKGEVDRLEDQHRELLKEEKKQKEELEKTKEVRIATENLDKAIQAERSKQSILNDFFQEKEKISQNIIKNQSQSNTLSEQSTELKNQIIILQRAYERDSTIEADCAEEIETIGNSLAGLVATGDGSSAGTGSFTDKKAHEEANIRQLETNIHLAKQSIRDCEDRIEDNKNRQKNEKVQFEQLKHDVFLLENKLSQQENYNLSKSRQLCAEVSTAISGKSLKTIKPDSINSTANMTLDNTIAVLSRHQPALQAQIAQLQGQIQDLRTRQSSSLNRPEWYGTKAKIDSMKRLNTQGLNTDQIYGILADQFMIKDPETFGLGIEVVAGARLFHICIATYDLGSRFLKQNQNATVPINMLTLDRINFKHDQNRIAETKRNFSSRGVILASDVVTPRSTAPPGIAQVLQSIFGNVFICPDGVVAKEIAGVGLRAVTTAGDSYDPGGLISGGSTNGMNWLKEYIHGLSFVDDAQGIHELIQEYEGLFGELMKFNNDKDGMYAIKKEIELKSDRISRSGFNKSQAIIDEANEQIIQKRGEIEHSEERLNHSKRLVQQYADTIKQMSGSNGDKKRIELKNEVAEKKKLRTKLSIITRESKTKLDDAIHTQRQCDEDNNEINAIIEDLKRRLEHATESFNDAVLSHSNSQESLAESRRKLNEATSKVEHLRDQVRQLQQNLKTNETAREAQKQRVIDFDVQVKAMDEKIEHLNSTLITLVKKQPWIKAEEDQFGVSDGYYHFPEGATVESLRVQLNEVQSRAKALEKYDDPSLGEKFAQLENDFVDKTKKLKSLQQDRHSIQKSIELLDQKKLETVENTYKVVDKYFGLIFSILLPGATSRLKAHRNSQNILIGVEMQVAFNGHWKDSLSELSGGQRALLALALILALLRCRPAPLYILDEVDAALDASNTQNIGKTIKEHFDMSQFIIISLKEGMFENANTLIRTQLGPNGSGVTIARKNQE